MSAAPTPTPTPTTSQRPSFDPANPATWLITTSAIGPAQLGEVDGDAINSVFEPAFTADSMCEGLTGYSPLDPSLGITALTGVSSYESVEHPGFLRTASIRAFDAALLGPVTGSPRTAEGIGLGSTLAEAAAAYPALAPWTNPRGGADGADGFTDHVITDAGGSLIFAVKSDRIVTITAAFDLPPAGYCG